MITSIEIPGTGVVFPIFDVSPNDPMYVRKINEEGLGPVDAAVNTRGYDDVDGEYYIGSAIGKRNIVLTLGINDVDAALNILYAWLRPKSGVKLQFNILGKDPVHIDGIVESAPFDRFSQDLEGTISIICPNPNFYNPTSLTVTGDSSGKVATDAHYDGNADAGFDFVLQIGSTPFSGDLQIEHRNPFMGISWVRTLRLNDIAIANDREIHINTEVGKKRVESRPVGDLVEVDNDLLPFMDPFSWWLTLFPGENDITVVTPGQFTAMTWQLTYIEKFGGI